MKFGVIGICSCYYIICGEYTVDTIKVIVNHEMTVQQCGVVSKSQNGI